MINGDTYFAAYRIGGNRVNIFDTNGCQRTSYCLPSSIVTPAALGPYVFVFAMEHGVYAIDARDGSVRQW